jgi:hypothetical protein
MTVKHVDILCKPFRHLKVEPPGMKLLVVMEGYQFLIGIGYVEDRLEIPRAPKYPYYGKWVFTFNWIPLRGRK